MEPAGKSHRGYKDHRNKPDQTVQQDRSDHLGFFFGIGAQSDEFNKIPPDARRQYRIKKQTEKMKPDNLDERDLQIHGADKG